MAGEGNGRIHVRARLKGLELTVEPVCVVARDNREAETAARGALERIAGSMAFPVPLGHLDYVFSQCPGQCDGWRPEGSDGD